MTAPHRPPSSRPFASRWATATADRATRDPGRPGVRLRWDEGAQRVGTHRSVDALGESRARRRRAMLP
ncbi:DUF6207 family protein [Streptomyces sp. NPDC006184]|uniref:DUF6207 family protein n=1 Tax=Streptomyces sp. NPDC006184 TaxID=3155455 RepID=UPI0033AB3907